MDRSVALKQPRFLPINLKEAGNLGWQELDIILISGDAYLDHPSQGVPLLGRFLVEHGFRVGIIPQPNWNDPKSFLVLGQAKLFVGISAGSMDSMLAHYTAFRKKRSQDALSPSGKIGLRPNRSILVYTGVARFVFPKTPIIIGGLEASLRRFSHYDFWQDKLRRSILLDAKADLLIYGPGERPILEIAKRLKNNSDNLENILGTMIISSENSPPQENFKTTVLASHEEIEKSPLALLTNTLTIEKELHQAKNALWQKSGKQAILAYPATLPLSTIELDNIYSLPFSKQAHPIYKNNIPALEILKYSITSHRGCGGGCSFCSLALDQGREISSRSLKSVLAEVEKLPLPRRSKKISLSDVGGPTANMWGARCLSDKSECQRVSCLWPQICRHFKEEAEVWLENLHKISNIPKVKQVRVASGLRYDLLLKTPKVAKVFFKKFVGGQLKIAPEHLSDKVLNLMRKPKRGVFEDFVKFFEENKTGNKIYLIPYLISAFPGCQKEDMVFLADWLKKKNWHPQQVQSFIPSPGTVATAMFYADSDLEQQPLKTAKSDQARQKQHQILLQK